MKLHAPTVFVKTSITFGDVHGLLLLPGLAVQYLMAEEFGFGSKGDWKTAALVRAMKVMGNRFSHERQRGRRRVRTGPVPTATRRVRRGSSPAAHITLALARR